MKQVSKCVQELKVFLENQYLTFTFCYSNTTHIANTWDMSDNMAEWNKYNTQEFNDKVVRLSKRGFSLCYRLTEGLQQTVRDNQDGSMNTTYI